MTPEELDARLIFGPGWVRRFETAETVPSLEVLVVMLDALGSNLLELVKGTDLDVAIDEGPTSVNRALEPKTAPTAMG